MTAHSFEAVFGHERPLKVLKRALSSGRLPQAYLFWGPAGVGKELVAREAARVLLCMDAEACGRASACGTCPACRQIDAGNHPDLHVLVAKGSSISIQEIRALKEALSYRAFERGRKVAILRDSFRMTREAGNALLKLLEEPPSDTYLFLLAHQRSQLIPTLVSRCQALRFDPLSREELRRLLLSRGVAEDASERLAEFAGGCPGTALAEEPEALGRLEQEVVEAWGALDPERGSTAAERFSLSDRWAKDKDRLGARLDRLEVELHRRIREGARGVGEASLLANLEGVFHVRRLLELNVNAQLALDSFFLGFLRGDWEIP
ncbi:MAG: DNA polymerase III subunit delta' [Deltaproteobacteria bacterium]|nr:DNA polymerase III subunit delta' [Deltaproteobacteria bacterium]